MLDFIELVSDTAFIWALIIGTVLTLGYIFMKSEEKEKEKGR